ncbi:MAG: exodeoxyribonuclease III [Treponema sp.]|nr:exodeoxyribonuclease III [Treponema sp.]
MRILSWNVNGIRAVEKKGFLQWVQNESPDMLCLQETKAEPGQLSQELLNPVDSEGAPYFAYWSSAKKKGYSGTAIYSKIEPLAVLQRFGLSEFDDEGRVLQTDYVDFSLICAYFPNAQGGGARLPYKLAFCDAMLKHCNALVEQGRHIVLCGDYNIAHEYIDLARPEENEGNSGFLPEERAWMDRWLEAGYIDTFRHFHPHEKGQYSWWTYRGRARERNVGWRIDYHCVDKNFLPCVEKSVIRTDVYGSDHCPVEIHLTKEYSDAS